MVVVLGRGRIFSSGEFFALSLSISLWFLLSATTNGRDVSLFTTLVTGSISKTTTSSIVVSSSSPVACAFRSCAVFSLWRNGDFLDSDFGTFQSLGVFFFSAASMPWASSRALMKVRSASASKRFCALVLRIPQTSQSRRASLSVSPNSQFVDRRRNSATYSAIDSSAA